MDYKNGKIYKVQFDDGHFYIGSTAGELRRRLHNHRAQQCKTACGRYIKIVGEDTCRIVLVEDYPCENKDQLRRKEDEHIQLNRNNEMCLNIMRAFLTPEEKKTDRQTYRETHREESQTYRETHKDKANEYRKAYYETHKEKVKIYNETRKEEKRAYDKAYYEAHK